MRVPFEAKLGMLAVVIGVGVPYGLATVRRRDQRDQLESRHVTSVTATASRRSPTLVDRFFTPSLSVREPAAPADDDVGAETPSGPTTASVSGRVFADATAAPAPSASASAPSASSRAARDEPLRAAASSLPALVPSASVAPAPRPAPTPPPPPSPSPCGPVTCASGQVCCNSSCGICVQPGGTCSNKVCGRPELVESVACGPSTCNVGQVCCNASCGICTVPGATCSSAHCDGPTVPVSVPCGMNTCNVGEVCCNASCGVCTPPGGSCSPVLCP